MAQAYLGEKKLNDPSTQIAVSSTGGITSEYEIQESVQDGRTIRQYVNKQDIVFAISWSGFAHPDLQILLGTYFPAYLKASAFGMESSGVGNGRRRPTRQSVYYGKKQSLVVRMGGHMGHVVGIAFDPFMAPASFAAGVDQ
jgi:hypothetical protein